MAFIFKRRIDPDNSDAPTTDEVAVPRHGIVRRHWRHWAVVAMAVALVAGWCLVLYLQAASERDAATEADLKTRNTALNERVDALTRQRDAAQSEVDRYKSNESRVQDRETAVKQREDAVKQREDAVTGQERTQAQNTIHPGNWAVGVDIQPGTYRTKDPVSDHCYWEITSDPNGRNIVANDIVTGGRPTVTISAGQYFKTERCGDWIKV